MVQKKLAEIREIGEYWCIKQAKDLIAHDVPGVHFYTLGKADRVAKIVREVF